MTFAGLDVHARSIHAAALGVESGELRRARFAGDCEAVLGWLGELPQPLHACYEAGSHRLRPLSRRSKRRPPGRRRRPQQDPARSWRSDQERPQGRRAPLPAAHGRPAEADRSPESGLRGSPPPLPSPRAGAGGPHALPPPRLQAPPAARACLPAADRLDEGAPRLARAAALRRGGREFEARAEEPSALGARRRTSSRESVARDAPPPLAAPLRATNGTPRCWQTQHSSQVCAGGAVIGTHWHHLRHPRLWLN
jgi:hypothetical protein